MIKIKKHKTGTKFSFDKAFLALFILRYFNRIRILNSFIFARINKPGHYSRKLN